MKELLEKLWNANRVINPCHINRWTDTWGQLIKDGLYVVKGRKVSVPNPNKLIGFTRPWGRFRSNEWPR